MNLFALVAVVTGLLATGPSVTEAWTSSSPQSRPRTSTAVSLFGGGASKKDGDKGGAGGGMMNQLAMFKKAQEVAQKKKQLDAELAAQPFPVQVADGKVKAQFQYVPVMNPLDPNPDYQALQFDFDPEYFASATAEELSQACRDAVLEGMTTINTAVAEKYAVLQQELVEGFGMPAAPGGGSTAASE